MTTAEALIERQKDTSPNLNPPCHAAPCLTKPEPAVETLLELYATTSPSVRRRGRSWYPEMYRLLKSMADRHGRPTAQAIAVCAITSANVQLVTNLKFTEAILKGERLYGCYPKHQQPLIERVLSTRYPGRFVRGPKCSAFFAAITGDTSALVLDRWAARAAGLDRPGRSDIYPGVRRQLVAAYREGAKICNESPRAFQAICWIAIRESTPNKRGIVPKLRDITKGD